MQALRGQRGPISVQGKRHVRALTASEQLASSRFRLRRAPGCAELIYMYDGDKNGVCWHLGSRGGSQPWVNPVLAGRLQVRQGQAGVKLLCFCVLGAVLFLVLHRCFTSGQRRLVRRRPKRCPDALRPLRAPAGAGQQPRLPQHRPQGAGRQQFCPLQLCGAAHGERAAVQVRPWLRLRLRGVACGSCGLGSACTLPVAASHAPGAALPARQPPLPCPSSPHTTPTLLLTLALACVLRSWWVLDLGPEHRLICNHYTLRHDGSTDFLRSWVLQVRWAAGEGGRTGWGRWRSRRLLGRRMPWQVHPPCLPALRCVDRSHARACSLAAAPRQGSNDGASWADLRRHISDRTVRMPGQYASWPVSSHAAAVPYRMFRLLLVGPNPEAANPHHVCLSFWELYGYLYSKQAGQGAGAAPCGA